MVTSDMIEPELKLAKAPIVEAVLDIDCDMPPAFEVSALERPAREAFKAAYPKFRSQFLEQHRFEAKPDEPSTHSTRRGIQAFRFLHDDEKQLVQVRAQGFSFNRLAPYTSLDDYLPEIQRTWELFRGIASPNKVLVIRLRYINRFLIPFTDGKLLLGDYIKNSPQLPENSNLIFAGFLNQHLAIEVGTGHEANIILTGQPPENEKLPIIFDNCVAGTGPVMPEDWPWILQKILSLRDLKNRIFKNTLTPQCLNLFQQ